MWDFPGPGIEPVSPAVAGGFLTTGPPGKSSPTFSLSLRLVHCSELFQIFFCSIVVLKYEAEAILQNNHWGDFAPERILPFSLKRIFNMTVKGIWRKCFVGPMWGIPEFLLLHLSPTGRYSVGSGIREPLPSVWVQSCCCL